MFQLACTPKCYLLVHKECQTNPEEMQYANYCLGIFSVRCFRSIFSIRTSVQMKIVVMKINFPFAMMGG